MSYEDGYAFSMPPGPLKTCADAIDNSFIGKFLNKYCTVQALGAGLDKCADKVSNACSSVKDFASMKIDDIKGLGKESVVAQDTPKLGRSGQVLARQETPEANTRDPRALDVPNEKVFEGMGLSSLKDMRGQSPTMQQMTMQDYHYSAAEVKEVAPMAVTSNAHFQQQQMQTGLGAA